MFSNKVKLAAGSNDNPPSTLPYPIPSSPTGLTILLATFIKDNFSPVIISTYILNPSVSKILVIFALAIYLPITRNFAPSNEDVLGCFKYKCLFKEIRSGGETLIVKFGITLNQQITLGVIVLLRINSRNINYTHPRAILHILLSTPLKRICLVIILIGWLL